MGISPWFCKSTDLKFQSQYRTECHLPMTRIIKWTSWHDHAMIMEKAKTYILTRILINESFWPKLADSSWPSNRNLEVNKVRNSDIRSEPEMAKSHFSSIIIWNGDFCHNEETGSVLAAQTANLILQVLSWILVLIDDTSWNWLTINWLSESRWRPAGRVVGGGIPSLAAPINISLGNLSDVCQCQATVTTQRHCVTARASRAKRPGEL